MIQPSEVESARKAYDARAWRDAREAYELAGSRTALEAEDLERLPGPRC